MPRPKSIVSLQDEDPSLRFINLLVHSHPGQGKTVLAGTAPKCLILDCDPGQGTQSARAQGSQADAVVCKEYDDVLDVYNWLAEELNAGRRPYEWGWWDSVTLFQNRTLIDEVMVEAVAQNPRQEKYVPSRREYLINMNRIAELCRLFVELPMNFGFSTHTEMVTDQSDGSTIWMPFIQGKGMPTLVSGYMNIVGYYGEAKVKGPSGDRNVRRLLTQRTGKYYAKDRFDALGKFVDNPTIPEIQAAVEARRTTSAAPAARRPMKKRRVS